jgi:hypothetical protein
MLLIYLVFKKFCFNGFIASFRKIKFHDNKGNTKINVSDLIKLSKLRFKKIINLLVFML